jgi:hypothetical protein
MYKPLSIATLEVGGIEHALRAMRHPMGSYAKAGWDADLALAHKLLKAGDEHSKALRGIVVWGELECQIGWFVEWRTYQVGVVDMSVSSTMHMDLRGMKGAELAEAKQSNLPNVVYRQGFMASYPALRRIWLQRRHHRHPDWAIFCRWIETLPHADTLIVPEAFKSCTDLSDGVS